MKLGNPEEFSSPKKKNYISPECELLDIARPFSLLARVSIEADFEDFEEIEEWL